MCSLLDYMGHIALVPNSAVPVAQFTLCRPCQSNSRRQRLNACRKEWLVRSVGKSTAVFIVSCLMLVWDWPNNESFGFFIGLKFL